MLKLLMIVGLCLNSATMFGKSHSNNSTSSKKPIAVPREAPAEAAPRQNFFQKISESFKSKKSNNQTRTWGTTSSGSTATVSKNSDVTTKRYVDARYLNTVFKGKLAGKGATIIAAAKANGVDPVFLAAVMAFESGWGTSARVREKNNPSGLTNNRKYMTFKSIDEGIYATAARLRGRYLDRGLTTVSSIARVYAPVGAKNDPKGTNWKWPGTVSGIMNKIVKGSVSI